MIQNLHLDVIGIHVLALWLLAEEIQPDDPATVATQFLKAAKTAYYEIPSEEFVAIAEAIDPKNWPPEESE